MSSVSRSALVVSCIVMCALIAGCATTDGLIMSSSSPSSTKHYRQTNNKKVARRHKPARVHNASVDKAVAIPTSGPTSRIETGSIDAKKPDDENGAQAIDSGDSIVVPPKQESRLPAEEPAAVEPVTSRDDPRWRWCEQRHIDHQAGRAPGGATDLAKKLEDDRICAAVYERG
ncbi:hypothetical protein [Hyphomicrobium sp. D-2]|uniref:hypothetical protein n=1 Tax=Hyphomicrobium sp. D-2 TaxID=3041621 RepID=UPI0024570714|nr:hypothetical protein [Hyphomicrobium sp. D-2]MDH4982347.1 hypothetical protein [Hyphomicrobium sp. D-2]